MNNSSAAELRAKLSSELVDAGYLLRGDGTHRPDIIVDGRYHTASIEGTKHPVLVVRANYARTRFVRTFNVINEAALQRALVELGRTVEPSFMGH